MGRGVGRFGHDGDIEEFGVRVERVDLAPVRKDLLHVEPEVVAVVTPGGSFVAADGADVVFHRAAHGNVERLAVRDLADRAGRIRLALVDAQDELHAMHLVIVPGEHRLADAFGRVLVHMLQEDVGVVDEELVGILQVLFRESVSVVVAAVVFFGGHTDDPEPGIAVILGDGIPKLLDFGGRSLGRRFGRRLDEGRDKARVDEADAGFACFGDFVPEVDDLVHVCWLQNVRVLAGNYAVTGKDWGMEDKKFIF